MNNIDSNTGEIVMYQPDETIRLEVRVENETVWLTQQQISDLFLRDRTVINRHINNVFKEGECDKESNVHFLHIPNSDKPVMYYSLDVIISVGYRVKSLNGTKFRRWANSVLKQYLLKGYAVNQRMFDIEQKVVEQGLEIAELRKKVDFFVRSSLPPVEGIFFDGQIFDAYVQIVNLIKQAKHSIVLIDNYIDETTLTILSKRDTNVSATIYTRQLSSQQQLDIERYNQQYQPITINICQRNHDRFLIIDDVVYLFGASLKDAGKKLFAYIKMQETPASVLKVIVLGSAEPFFMPFYDTLQPIYPTLSQSHFLVATTSTRIWLIIWNQPKIPVPLHQLFESYVCSFCINLFWLLVFWFRNEKRLAAASLLYTPNLS